MANSHGKKLTISASSDEWLTLYISFNWQDETMPIFTQQSDRESIASPVAKQLQNGSLGFLKSLQEFFKSINPIGVRIKYLPVVGKDKNERRDIIYSRILSKAGYERSTDDTWIPKLSITSI